METGEYLKEKELNTSIPFIKFLFFAFIWYLFGLFLVGLILSVVFLNNIKI